MRYAILATLYFLVVMAFDLTQNDLRISRDFLHAAASATHP